MNYKIKHKSLKEWCRSTRWISCRNLRYSNPRCFDRTKNVCLFIEWSTKITQLSVWHILEMLYFAYCMDKYAKSEEESLTKVCVDFNIKNNTNTEPQQGRLDLRGIRCADQKNMRMPWWLVNIGNLYLYWYSDEVHRFSSSWEYLKLLRGLRSFLKISLHTISLIINIILCRQCVRMRHGKCIDM